MTDLSALSDDELLALYGKTDASRAMPALIATESSGRPGVLGPPTKYGRAEGLTQMLPQTARAQAAKLGLPWRPEMMTATTPEAADYQRQLGQGYLQEGIDKTGSVEDGLRYYHGGPNPAQWGPKTEAYVQKVSARMGGDTPAPQGPDLSTMSDAELLAMYDKPAVTSRSVARKALPQLPAKPPVNVAADIAKSGAAGAAQGFTSIPGLPGDLFSMWNDKVVNPIVHALNPNGVPVNNALPSSQALNNARQVISGIKDHQPETTAGEFARTVGQFAPAALVPGSVAARVANVVVPGLASEGAGQITKGKPYEGAARIGAALITGGLTPRISASIFDKPVVPTLDAAVPQAAARRAQAYVGKVTAPGAPMAPVMASKPFTAAEAAGRPAQVALGALARRDGATGDALGGLVGGRQLTRPTRILGDVEQATGLRPEAVSGDMSALTDTLKAEAAPLYEAAYAKPVEFTARLESLAKRPQVQAALDDAMGLISNDPSIPPDVAAQIKASGTSSPQLWDYAHRALNDKVQTLIDPVTGKLTKPTEGRILTSLSSELNGAIREASPEMGAAWDKAGDYLKLNQAFRDGKSLLENSNVTEAQFSAKLGKLSAAETNAFKGGVANSYFELAQKGRLDPKVMKTPRVRAKLTAVLGDDAAQSLIDSAGQEGAMQAFERRYAPGANSGTAENLEAMRQQDAGGGIANAAADIGMRLAGGQGVRGSLAGAALGQIKRLDAVRRTAGMPIAARDEAGRMLMMSPEDLRAYLTTLPKQQGMFGSFRPVNAAAAGLLAAQ